MPSILIRIADGFRSLATKRPPVSAHTLRTGLAETSDYVSGKAAYVSAKSSNGFEFNMCAAVVKGQHPSCREVGWGIGEILAALNMLVYLSVF